MRIAAFAALAIVALSSAAQQNPSAMKKIGQVDPRFQSYNVEMVEVIGGRFWKPYGSPVAAAAAPAAAPGGLDPALFEQRKPIDLTNPRLRKLAAALGPAFLRVSGTWANTVYFQDDDGPVLASPPEGFNGVLTRAQWNSVVGFSKAVNAKIVTSFSVSAGTRNSSGVWTPEQAARFVAYTHAVGGSIAAAEFINEPTFITAAGVPPGYDAAAYGRDFAVFAPFLRKAAPEALLLGPGSVGEGIPLVPMKLLPSKDLLEATRKNPLDVFSYHFYGGASERCGTGPAAQSATHPENALSQEWLGRTATVEAFYAGLRNQYAPGKPLWVTETGQTACGGDRWASTFLDSFRYLDQLGKLASLGVQVVMHNTLAASDYGLIDEKTLAPRPNYWAALLWHRTMGTIVLDAGKAPSPDVHLYAQCTPDHPGGVTLLALNLSRTDPAAMNLPRGSTRYTLTADDLVGHGVSLNGNALQLSAAGELPALAGVAQPKGSLSIPAASITFFTFAEAGNPACR